MAKEKKNTLAVQVESVLTISQHVNKFVSELTAAQQSTVREATQQIVGAQQKMVEARIMVGAALAKLHSTLGNRKDNPQNFDGWISSVGRFLGVSRSTAYRYLGGYKLVQQDFGQAASAVLALTDGGNSIVKVPDKSSNGALALTPTAKMVLAKMQKEAPLPNNASSDQCAKWAETFSTLVKKADKNTEKNSPFQIIKNKIDDLDARFSCETPKGILERIGELKNAVERKQATVILRETIEKWLEEIQPLTKTFDAIPDKKDKGKKAA